jgi:hypothetical protein
VSFGAPHDEHRLLIPRIVIIASMFAFKGDYRMQCCISFLVVEIISLCFLWLLIRDSVLKVPQKEEVMVSSWEQLTTN